MKNLLFAISLMTYALTATSKAAVGRIQSLRFDKSKIEKIYLAPGLGSILIFPCSLSEAFVGRNEDLKAQVSPNDKKILFLNLKLSVSLPTNMIVRCDGVREVFVFDVIPSRVNHQDVIEIRSSFGRPVNQDQKSLVEKREVTKLVIKKPVQVDEGDIK